MESAVQSSGRASGAAGAGAGETGLRWAARLLSLASLGLILMFAFGGEEAGGMPTLKEWGALAFFPIGVQVGMLLAWKKEIAGAGVALAALAGFYVYYLFMSGALPGGPYFALFSLPAVLFLICGSMARARRVRAAR